MKRLLLAACTLSLFACGGPEAEWAEDEAAISRYVPTPTRCALPQHVPNAVTENDPRMTAHPACASGLVGAPGAPCYFADDCAHGLCMRDPHYAGAGVCGKWAASTANCESSMGSGWAANFVDFDFSPTLGADETYVYQMCTYVGPLYSSLQASQGPDEVCVINEHCAATSEACVHHWDEFFGRCGFYVPSTGCPAGHDYDTIDQGAYDIGDLCHL